MVFARPIYDSEGPTGLGEMAGSVGGGSAQYAPELAQQHWMKERNKERRERIATATLAGMLADHVDGSTGQVWSYGDAALHAVKYADALILELDKE